MSPVLFYLKLNLWFRVQISMWRDNSLNLMEACYCHPGTIGYKTAQRGWIDSELLVKPDRWVSI